MSTPQNFSPRSSNNSNEDAGTERIGFDDVQPFNLDPNYDPREGLWDPERHNQEKPPRKVPEPAPPVHIRKRRRALPKSWVNFTLRAMLVIILIGVIWGVIF